MYDVGSLNLAVILDKTLREFVVAFCLKNATHLSTSMALSKLALDGIIDDLFGNQELGRLQDPLENRFVELEQSIEANNQLLRSGPPQSGESQIAQAETVLAEAKVAFDLAVKNRNTAHEKRHEAGQVLKKAKKLLKKQQQRMKRDEEDDEDEDEDLIEMQNRLLVKKEKAVAKAEKDFAEKETVATDADNALKDAHDAKKSAKKALKAAKAAPEKPAEETDLEDVKRQLIDDQNRYMQYKLFHAHFLIFLNELPSSVRVPVVPEGLSYTEFIDFVKSSLESIDDQDVYASVAQTNTPAPVSTSSQSRKRSAPDDEDDEDEASQPKRSKPLGPGVPVSRPTQGGKSITHGGYFMTSQALADFEGESDDE
ncbi:MAG: hypothetical protein CMP20_01450 [Rickettsiales bacterium]|nr:hypothetical protein [Rickettsiales bacterium]